MSNLDREIKIHLSNGQYFIWDIDDIKFIRKNFKVTGSFVGSPSWKGLNFQNKIHGLPLKLLDEECLFLLTECRNVKLIKQDFNSQELIENCLKEFQKFDNQFINEFKQFHFQNSVNQIKKKLDLIVEGKAKKNKVTVDQMDRDQILEIEIKKIKSFDENNQPKQFLVQSPWSSCFKNVDLDDEFKNYLNILKNGLNEEFSHCQKELIINKFNNEETRKNFIKLGEKLIKKETGNEMPILKDEHLLLRYFVYKDLNKKGLYLTKGNKFGSEFLAYPIDPLFCHAAYLVICLSHNQQFTKTLLNTYTRLGSQVNKNVLLVRFRNDNHNLNKKNCENVNKMKNFSEELEYLVIKWKSDN